MLGYNTAYIYFVVDSGRGGGGYVAFGCALDPYI